MIRMVSQCSFKAVSEFVQFKPCNCYYLINVTVFCYSTFAAPYERCFHQTLFWTFSLPLNQQRLKIITIMITVVLKLIHFQWYYYYSRVKEDYFQRLIISTSHATYQNLVPDQAPAHTLPRPPQPNPTQPYSDTSTQPSPFVAQIHFKKLLIRSGRQLLIYFLIKQFSQIWNMVQDFKTITDRFNIEDSENA